MPQNARLRTALENQNCSFRIALGPAGRGRGLGTEATRLIVGYGFERLGLYRISLEVYSFNPRGLRVVPNVVHAECTGGFALAEAVNGAAACIETALTGQVFEDAKVVLELSARSDALRTEALRGTDQSPTGTALGSRPVGCA